MKAKNSLKCIFEIYKESLNNQKFTLIFILSLVLSIYSILGIAFGLDYINGFINIISFGIYIACLFLIILLNTYNVFNIFEKNQFFIIRYTSKKQYLLELIKTICFSNLCIVILNIILVIIGLNLFCENQTVNNIKNYNMSGVIYLIYSLIKLIILTQFVSIINILLSKFLNNKLVTILNIILYILIAGLPINTSVISNVLEISLFIGTYLRYQLYSSFLFEIICFILYIALLYILINILFKITLKKMQAVIK